MNVNELFLFHLFPTLQGVFLWLHQNEPIVKKIACEDAVRIASGVCNNALPVLLLQLLHIFPSIRRRLGVGMSPCHHWLSYMVQETEKVANNQSTHSSADVKPILRFGHIASSREHSIPHRRTGFDPSGKRIIANNNELQVIVKLGFVYTT